MSYDPGEKIKDIECIEINEQDVGVWIDPIGKVYQNTRYRKKQSNFVLISSFR